jgi:uncharacterized Zn finger protein
MIPHEISCPHCARKLDLIQEASNYYCERCGIVWTWWKLPTKETSDGTQNKPD